MSEYQQKLDSALTLVQEHNAVVAPEPSSIPPEGYIDPEKFSQCIRFKARNEDALKSLRYENILECLPTAFGVKPDSLAKDIAKVFRGQEASSATIEPVISGVSEKKVSKMLEAELITHLQVDDPSSAVYKRLKGMAGDTPFIIFSNGRTVDAVATLKLFKEIRLGYPARDVYDEKEVFPLGVLPDNFAEENPLYHERPLRPDGSCDQTQRSWEGVSQTVRQLVYIAVERGDIKVNGDNGTHVANDIINIAIGSDAEKVLRQRFQKAATEFNKLERNGDLPKLRVALGEKANKGGANGPFPEGRKVDWAKPHPTANYFVVQSHTTNSSNKQRR